ncbi:MAG: tripartite tricarboxylate transporter permease [Chloroflexi bacterium]|nr:tripartite tricarboxylate transporter permease [Chloroflexota bacterium]
MVFDALLQAISSFGSAELWFFMMLGIIVGLIFGIIPTVGGLLALSLFLPFIFKMTPMQGLPLLMAIETVIFTGGAITTILVGIPGTAPNSATLLDGYPLTQKGQAGRALGAGLAACGFGSIVSSVLAIALVPLVLAMVMELRTADMVFLVLMGIAFLAVLSRGSIAKGLISGGLGMVISLIGFQQVTGVARFTFDNIYLYDGFSTIPVVLGIFVIPEIMALAVKGGSIAKAGAFIRGMTGIWQGALDVFRHRRVAIESSVIAFVVGIIPGIGAMVATFVAYGRAKQISKHPELFGTGVIEGVIAPECANDGKECGALLTTLALGIPGSESMVLFLAAMMLVGLTPGPDMLTKNLDLSFTLLLVSLVASVVGVIICFSLAQHLAKIALVPARILTPVILIITSVGVYAGGEEMYDLIAFVIFGGLGVLLKKFDFNRPALVLGFILGDLFEQNLFLALRLGGPFFFLRPASLIIIVLILLVFMYGPSKKLLLRGRGAAKV